jgi:hypothetical protein
VYPVSSLSSRNPASSGVSFFSIIVRLPTIGGMYMAGKASHIGENIASAPFKLFRKNQPVQQPVQQEPQPMG